MRGSENFEVAQNVSYSDIMVPTMDTIRSAYIIHMLATNQRPVSSRFSFANNTINEHKFMAIQKHKNTNEELHVETIGKCVNLLPKQLRPARS